MNERKWKEDRQLSLFLNSFTFTLNTNSLSNFIHTISCMYKVWKETQRERTGSCVASKFKANSNLNFELLSLLIEKKRAAKFLVKINFQGHQPWIKN